MGRHTLFTTGLLAWGMAFSTVPAAWAETVSYGADLSGAAESPPNDSTGSGAAKMKFDTQTKELSWVIEYQGLSGKSIGAHIHGVAPAGTNAGVLIPFKSPQSPIEGSAVLTDRQVEALEGGKLYVNVHTAAHPGGELRGQIMKQ